MQAPEDFAVVQMESSFRSPGHSNVSPGSAGHIWHAPWIQDDAFKTGKITPKNRGKNSQKNRKKD